MKKTIIFLILLGVGIGVGIWLYNSNKVTNIQNESNYQAERSSANKTNNINSNISNTNINTLHVKTKKELEMAQFTTKIYNNDSERQNNITITCNALNNKEIQPGETFSFCDTVGKATSEKGYQQADIYVEGKKTQGLGGGNCQVSTTLYNVVTQIPELEIVERHTHSGKVPYIEAGKDAAVAYGSYDLKFKNNSQSVVKIVMTNDEKNITAKIMKIE